MKMDKVAGSRNDELYTYKEGYEFAIRQVYSALEQVTK